MLRRRFSAPLLNFSETRRFSLYIKQLPRNAVNATTRVHYDHSKKVLLPMQASSASNGNKQAMETSSASKQFKQTDYF